MESIFSSSAAAKFGRESKPVEFKKKRAEVTPRLDEEEQAREDARAARNLAKKAKRTVKPRKEDAGKKDAPAPPAAPASGTKNKPEKERKPKKIVKSEDDGESSAQDQDQEQEQEQEQEVDVNSKDARTAFFGNVPITETEKSLTAFCSEFGEVESIRLRSLPVAGTAVDDNGNQDLVRKVCAIKKKFGGQKGSFNAYVVFKSADAVTKALKANNRIMGATAATAATGDGKKQQENKKGRHLRVDRVNPTLFDPAVTVYVGGVPHYCDEEELREHFAAVLPKGQRDLHSIRIVRDPETLIGRGFAYVLLSNRDAVLQALTLHDKKYRKRWDLRVQVCGKRTKRVKKNESTSDSSKPAVGVKKRVRGGKEEEGKKGKEGKGEGEGEEKSKKPRWRDLNMTPDEIAAKKANNVTANNSAAAFKRIQKGSSKVHKKSGKNTRTNVLKEKGQMKKEKGRKGKRLGGVVKRAMAVEKKKKE